MSARIRTCGLEDDLELGQSDRWRWTTHGTSTAIPAFPAADINADSSPRINSTVPSANATERYDSEGVCDNAAIG